MAALSRSLPLALTLALGLGVIGCAVPPTPLAQSPVRKAVGSAGLVLVPRIAEGRLAQAVVSRPTAANINRLVVIPMVETSPGQYQPFTADGTPTVLGDAQAVSLSRSVPDLRLGKGIQLKGLAPDTRYRILARAYDAQDKLLSKDADSTVDVNVTHDDAPTSTAIPVVLADVPFAARTTVTLTHATSADYASVETSLVTVADGIETPVSGTTQTLSKAQMPMILTLEGLRANTTYRLKASLRDGTDAEVATASVAIEVTDDDAPAAKTLTLKTAANPNWTVTTLAGSTQGDLDATGTTARFNEPRDIAVDAAGNVFVADSYNRRIRKITPQGVVTTLAGSGATGTADGTGIDAQLTFPAGIAIDASGNLFVADSGNHRIRQITPQGVVTTLAGSTQGYADDTGTAAQFDTPSGVAVDATGNVFVADTGNHRIRKLMKSGANWTVTTLAGSTLGYLDATGTAARLNGPIGIAVDAAGNVLFADAYNHRIRQVTPQGVVTTLAGGTQGFADGTGTAAQFSVPYGLTIDAWGNLLVADYFNNSIRRVTPGGVVTTFAGSTEGEADGTGLAAQFTLPCGIAVDAEGCIYVADMLNNRIRKIVP